MDDLKILRDSGLLDHRHEPIRQNRSVDKYHRFPGPADIILDVRPVQLYSFHSWALQSFSQSLCDEKGVAGLLQAPDLAVSQCPEMGESGLHPPPLLRNAEIASENDHVIARLEVLVPFRVELVEVGREFEEIKNPVDTAIDAPLGNPSAISHSTSSARSDLKVFTSPMASYNFRMRAICDVSDMRNLLRLMLMAHSRAIPK